MILSMVSCSVLLVRLTLFCSMFRFELAELIRVSLFLMLVTFVAASKNINWPLCIAAIVLSFLLLLKQPDFGTFAICSAVIFVTLFVFGLKWRYILSGTLVAIPLFYLMVMRVDYRRARVLAFLDPWADPAQKGFQVIQSMLSIKSGGLFGVGLGQGQGKLFFLPEAHTDFTSAYIVTGKQIGRAHV